MRGVANGLNRDKIPPPGKSTGNNSWNDSTIGYILKNLKYLGWFVWGARGTGQYNTACNGRITPRRKNERPAKGEPIIHRGKHEAIIDQETFDGAQSKLKRQSRRSAPQTFRQYVLSGLLRCGDCDGSMVGVKVRTKTSGSRYLCGKYQRAGKSACYCNSIAEGPVVACLVAKIQEHYLSRSAFARLRKVLEAEQDRDRSAAMKDLDHNRREIESLDRKITNAEESVLEAPPKIRPGLYRKLEELVAKRDRLKTDIEGAEAPPDKPTSAVASKREIQEAIKDLRGLSRALKRSKPEATQDLLLSIIDRIELRFDHGSYGKLERSKFREGTVFMRPGAIDSHLTETGRCTVSYAHPARSVHLPSIPAPYHGPCGYPSVPALSR